MAGDLMKVPAPNFTQTPNDLFDHWLPHLSEGELKVLLVIMRKTFGWHKPSDAISVSQLAKYTGMLEETVIKAARSLQSKGVVSREVIGSPGKQQTIYSLVVEDNSNNSYPSVQPRGPLGLNPPVSTEAQKKPSSCKQTKQQQKASPSSAAASFYKELEGIDIPLEDKVYIAKTYPLENVKHAILWLQNNTKPLTKGIAAALKWAAKTLPQLPVASEGLEQANRAYALRYDGLRGSNCKIEALRKHVEIVYSGNASPVAFTYNMKGFMDQFMNALRKNNFQLIEQT